MSEQIKPCPFCGGTACLSDDSDFGCMHIECEYCYAKSISNPDKDLIMRYWNRRAIRCDMRGQKPANPAKKRKS